MALGEAESTAVDAEQVTSKPPAPPPAGAADPSNQYGVAFRTYAPEALLHGPRPSVEENYRLNHTHQTYEFAQSCRARWGRFDTLKLSVWEAAELLNEVVDDSDPDTALPQLEHLLQTAEACRAAYPDHDWLHLTGLIHDLGKVLAHPAFGSQPQWAVVGDTFPVGCGHDPAVIFHAHFAANPDAADPRYSSPLGVYAPGCGLRNVTMSWGHDEYMYMVLEHNGCLLPPEAKFIVRYHSFYALHQAGAYGHLLDDSDRDALPWLKAFQKCDLYSKGAERQDVAALRPYYSSLIAKYFPKQVLDW